MLLFHQRLYIFQDGRGRENVESEIGKFPINLMQKGCFHGEGMSTRNQMTIFQDLVDAGCPFAVAHHHQCGRIHQKWIYHFRARHRQSVSEKTVKAQNQSLTKLISHPTKQFFAISRVL